MATCLITGANRGIGLELARQCAAGGMQVLATCRDPDHATALQALAQDSEGRVAVLPLDVASGQSVAELKLALGAAPIDLLINNAGVMGPDPQTPLAMDFDGFADVLNVNLLGALRVTQALVDNVAAAKGKISVISSMMAQYDFGGTSKLAYCVSKTAVTRAFHMLASDVRGRGITVCILSPGWVQTDMGSAAAPLTAQQSAAGLLKQIGGWQLKDSGAFRNYAGGEMEW
jgi:NAD(P)-dependent dehydrogenase (short-subunit alcohol dehydrogenase family)